MINHGSQRVGLGVGVCPPFWGFRPGGRSEGRRLMRGVPLSVRGGRVASAVRPWYGRRAAGRSRGRRKPLLTPIGARCTLQMPFAEAGRTEPKGTGKVSHCGGHFASQVRVLVRERAVRALRWGTVPFALR